MKQFWWLLCVFGLLLAASPAHAAPLLRFQGQAVDSQQVPLEGPYTLTFKLYPAATGGSPVWTEVQPSIPLSGGHFSVLLGSVTALTSVDWSVPLWLGIQVGTDPELTPRQPITTVPLAIRADTAVLAQQATSLTAAITPALITPQGSGSGLDADKVDGKDASQLVKAGDAAGGDLAGTYPNPTLNPTVLGFRGMQVFTTSGTWVRPPSVNRVYVRVWGGGGAGAGGDDWNGSGPGGGGGGSGAHAEGIVSVTGDVPVTIGAGANSPGMVANGGSGGSSSFGSSVIAGGGSGGGVNGTGGVGGTATAGDLQRNGASGNSGATDYGGAGGHCPMGGAGGSGGPVESRPGISGGFPGGGGGGGANSSVGTDIGPPGFAGGAGGAGLVIVMW